MLSGESVTKSLLLVAIGIKPYERETLDEWLSRSNASLRGALEGVLAQRDACAQVKALLEESFCDSFPLADAASKVDGNWQPSVLAKAIDEQGSDFHVYLEHRATDKDEWMISCFPF